MNKEQANTEPPAQAAATEENVKMKSGQTADSGGGVDNADAAPNVVHASSNDESQRLIPGIINNAGILCRHCKEGTRMQAAFDPMLDKGIKLLSRVRYMGRRNYA